MLHVLVDERHGDDDHANSQADEEEDVDHVHHQPGQQQPARAANTGNNLNTMGSRI